MKIGLLGRKIGMTRVFTAAGASIPVTVVRVERNRVSQVKTKAIDGYDAVQLTAGSKKPSRVNKPLTGHFAKAEIEAGDIISDLVVPDNLDTEETEASIELNFAVVKFKYSVKKKSKA